MQWVMVEKKTGKIKHPYIPPGDGVCPNTYEYLCVSDSVLELYSDNRPGGIYFALLDHYRSRVSEVLEITESEK